MNEVQVATPVAVLASYVQGRNDGFRSGVVFGAGAVILYRMLRKRSEGMSVKFVRNNKR